MPFFYGKDSGGIDAGTNIITATASGEAGTHSHLGFYFNGSFGEKIGRMAFLWLFVVMLTDLIANFAVFFM